ncbi:MAG: hypothetical protein GY854_26580, partial [Deltaproteobacteria bacterium]|nr:hypothetical protein [Deltaproteobacteria bacterium]
DTDTDTNTETGLTVEITEPDYASEFEHGTPVTFVGIVGDDTYNPDELSVVWSSDVDGVLNQDAPTADGAVTMTTSTLSEGYHTISLEITSPDNEQNSATTIIGICTWGDPETFDADLTGSKWKIYGDAYWDTGGWLEMTGDFQNMQGAIFNVVDKVNPGDVSIAFLIATGPNTEFGADGFAMSVINAGDVAQLEQFIAAGRNGGGLGYGVSFDYGPMNIEAFHIEIDTWYNTDNGDTELHTDPTQDNHIGVTLNGNPEEHLLWAPVPNIEDLEWHEVIVEVEGINVRVSLDGTEMVNDNLEGWTGFRGGYIGFTGTTGFYTNYHRFDELRILQECIVN